METLKFKVGDKVRVKSLEWYNSEKKNERGTIEEGASFTKEMSALCGSVLTIDDKGNSLYVVYENSYYWQDWMLEDELVAEEKKEVEQLNQNSMETKVMTKEEVFAYLNKTKIICTSVEETAKVQKKLFELGITWAGDKIANTDDVVNEDAFLLFVEDNNILFDADISYFMQDKSRKIEPSEILAIQIKEEKPKFDPQSLQPFDKVLVKDCAVATGVKEWVARFF